MQEMIYEWKKLWKKAAVVRLSLVFLLVSGLIFWGELKEDSAWREMYLQLHEQLDEKEPKAAAEWLEREAEDSYDEEENEHIYEKQRAIETVLEELEALQSYGAYREQIQERWEQNSQISIFAGNAQEENRYMERIAEVYGKLSVAAPMALQPCQGIRRLLDFYAGDLLTLIFLFYLVSTVFVQEQKNGKLEFARTMIRGRRMLFWAKTAVLYGGILLYAAGTFLIQLMLVYGTYGGISFGMAAQSVPGLYGVPFAWTLGEYFLARAGLRCAALLVFSALAVFLARVVGSETGVFAGFAAFVGGSVWAGGRIPGEGTGEMLRLWNPWTLLRGRSVICSYEPVQMGGLLVEASWGLLFWILLASVLLGIGGSCFWKEKKRKRKKRRRRETVPHGLFFYEMKKLWIYQGGIFLFAVCLLLLLWSVKEFKNPLGTEEFYYHQYIDRLGDRIEEETPRKLEEEAERLEQIARDLEQEESFARRYELEHELEKQLGFYRYTGRVQALQEGGRENILLKDGQYRLLFERTEVSENMILLFWISLAFLIPPAFRKERETGMARLQRTTCFGGKKLWNSRLMAIQIYFFLFFLLFTVLAAGKTGQMYELNWMGEVRCLEQYWETGIALPVWLFYLIGSVFRWILAAAAVQLLAFAAARLRSSYALTGILLGAGMIPILSGEYSPVSWLSWFHDLFFVFNWKTGVLVLLGAAGMVGAWMTWREERR